MPGWAGGASLNGRERIVPLSNWYNVQVIDCCVIRKISCDERTTPLQLRRGNPGICRLDALAGATALIYDLGPECTRTIIWIKCQVQRHVLLESAATCGSPVTAFGPKQQLGSGHERND